MARERGEQESRGLETGPELVTEPVELTAICKGSLGVSGAESAPLGRVVRIRQLDGESLRVVMRMVKSSPYSLLSEWSELQESLVKSLSLPGFVLLGIFGEDGSLEAFAVGARGFDALGRGGDELRRSRFLKSRVELGGFAPTDGFVLAVWCDDRIRRKRFGTALMHALMSVLRDDGANRVVAFVRYAPRRVGEQIYDWDKLYGDFLKRSGLGEIGTDPCFTRNSTVFVYAREVAQAAEFSAPGAIETRGVGRGDERVEIAGHPEIPAAK